MTTTQSVERYPCGTWRRVRRGKAAKIERQRGALARLVRRHGAEPADARVLREMTVLRLATDSVVPEDANG